MVTVLFEVEYYTSDEEEARSLAEGHAGWVFSHPQVESVTVDLKRPKADELPITARYLEDDLG